MSPAGARGDELATALRARLLAPEAAVQLEVSGDTNAAVLVPLYEHQGELHVVFTRRRDDLRRHPGEISFPGGRHEADDADLVRTALRETEEEIGLAPAAVRIAGALRPTPTIATGYAIYPFVGVIEPGAQWTLSPDEVASVLELTLTDLRAGYATPAAAAPRAADPYRHLRRRRRADLGRDRADPPGPAGAPARIDDEAEGNAHVRGKTRHSVSPDLAAPSPAQPESAPRASSARCTASSAAGVHASWSSGSAVSSTYGISDRSQAVATTPAPADSTAGSTVPAAS